MHKIWESVNKKMCLHVTIKCSGKQRFRVWAEDYGKKNSKYVDRTIDVTGERTIDFKFPVTPKQLFIGCLNVNNVSDKSFSMEIIEAPLETYNIYIDDDTVDFLKLGIHFSQVCGFKHATANGRLFQTSDGKFTIRYYPVIRDVMTNRAMTTPARIGHNTGVIDASQFKFDGYTVAMRMMILLHEFSHKYKNPKIGLEISNEVGADINALYIYLGLGFSKVDAIWVFANVFLKAQTPDNMHRMRKIMEYIQKFENQEFAQKN